jgi:glycosyltransferase involved in cell wall biosynthesis
MFASTYEGFGLPIIEANAVGRPVVTSHLWSMPEVAGKSALLVDPYDVASIRDGVLSIIEDAHLRSVLIKNGLENIKRFRLSLIAEQYSALYQEVYLKSRKR